MSKIPYEIVYIEASKILGKLLYSKDSSEIVKYYDDYLDFLQATGWTEEEFDKEISVRVDLNWDDPKPRMN